MPRRVACHDEGSYRDASAEIASWQWRQIVNGATDTAIITTDPHGAVTSWNKGAANILGWDEAEMLGKSLSRIFAEDDQLAQLSREIEDATSVARAAAKKGGGFAKMGSRFWAVGELSPIRDGTEVVGFIKILRDRTAQRDAEEIIREERHALEEIGRASCRERV